MTNAADAAAFGPTEILTRQEWAGLISLFGEDFLCLHENPEIVCTFNDSGSINPFYFNATTKACRLGLILGIEGSFYPNVVVTRSQVLATMARAMNWYMDETTTPWYLHYHNYAYENGLTADTNINGFETWSSKEEALITLYRARNYECKFDTVDPSNWDITISLTSWIWWVYRVIPLPMSIILSSWVSSSGMVVNTTIKIKKKKMLKFFRQRKL